MSRVSSLLVASVLVASAAALSAQDKDPKVRVLTTEAVKFVLPTGWEWKSEAATNIAIKQTVKSGAQTDEITAELTYEANGFLGDSINNLQHKVTASKGDLKDLQVKKKEKFAGCNAVLALLTRVSGEGKDAVEVEERNWFWRRNGALYRWQELNLKAVSGPASSAFNTARAALTFTKPLSADVALRTRNLTEQKAKFTLPEDWEWQGIQGKENKDGFPFAAYTLVSVNLPKGKTATYSIHVLMEAQKWTEPVEHAYTGTNEGKFKKDYPEMKDYQVDKKALFGTEHAYQVSFVAAHAAAEGAPARPAQLERFTSFVKKGWIFTWHETLPLGGGGPAVDDVLKKARAGFAFE